MEGKGGMFFFGLLAIGAIAVALAMRGQSSSSRSSLTEWQPVARTPNPEEPPTVTSYDNIEEIELLDIDKDLLMPRKIIIHRKARVTNELHS